MHPHPLVGPYSPSLAGHKVITCVTHSLAPFMALIVDEIEEEEDGGRSGGGRRKGRFHEVCNTDHFLTFNTSVAMKPVAESNQTYSPGG